MPDNPLACSVDGSVPPSPDPTDTATLEGLDLRHLPAPAPLERGLAAAEALAPGATLVLLTPMLPIPLLQLLEIRGFQVQACLLDEGGARVDIRRPPD